MRRFPLWRRLFSAGMLTLTGLCTLLVLLPLFLILYYVARAGVTALSLDFFTHIPAPIGVPGGGMANAIVGTLELLGTAMLIGLPLGLAGGIYVAEFGRERLAMVVRFSADVLNGIPTIVTGIFIYVLVVAPQHHFSGLAGALAYAIILAPVMLRATDEVLRTVPGSYREAAMALGANRWRVTRDVVLRAARPGLISGALLGLARIAGETAPLLFTASNNAYFSTRLDRPLASMTVQIYLYAISPFHSWHAQAWAAALTLLVMVLAFNLLARLLAR